MRVLIINKFLHRNGGSETYIFKLGEALEQHGHEVQYFGMEHEGRCVGNRVNAYTSDMDFHGGSKLSKLTYPWLIWPLWRARSPSSTSSTASAPATRSRRSPCGIT